MDVKRLEELFGSQEFVDALKAAGKAEEVVRLFAANGVEVSTEGAEAFLADRDKASDGELSEDALDGVAGGINAFGAAKTGAKFFWWWMKNYSRYGTNPLAPLVL